MPKITVNFVGRYARCTAWSTKYPVSRGQILSDHPVEDHYTLLSRSREESCCTMCTLWPGSSWLRSYLSKPSSTITFGTCFRAFFWSLLWKVENWRTWIESGPPGESTPLGESIPLGESDPLNDSSPLSPLSWIMEAISRSPSTTSTASVNDAATPPSFGWLRRRWSSPLSVHVCCNLLGEEINALSFYKEHFLETTTYRVHQQVGHQWFLVSFQIVRQ